MHFFGTGDSDTIIGTGQDDVFDMSQGGHDLVKGRGGDDIFLFGGQLFGADTIIGGPGKDTLVLDGPYQLLTRFGARTISGIEVLRMIGDHSYALKLKDGNVAAGETLKVVALIWNGSAMSFDGRAEQDGMFHITGSVQDDGIKGGAMSDTLDGGKGHDLLWGGAGKDVLIGREGADQLTGGEGADRFVYLALDDTRGSNDLILDLEKHDRIDLSAIDADVGSDGDQAFVLAGAFSGHAGEAVLSYDAVRDLTTLGLDVDGDAKADAAITMSGDHTGFTGFDL